MKDKSFYLKIIIVVLAVLNGVTFSVFYNKQPLEVPNDYCYYEDDQNYILIEKNTPLEQYASYLYKNNEDDYISKIYEVGTNKEILIPDLIKEERLAEYNTKITELLYKKYPKYIAQELNLETVKKSYLLRNNELVIYFNDYNIEPPVKETLYLTVNYNEIKDYLNFTVSLDATSKIEDGYNYTNAKKSVAITFDDSPNKNKTNKILEYLSDNKSHATFFVLGEKAIANKDLLINIKNMGNEIGSHTYKHENMKYMSDEEIIADYEKMNTIYKNIFKEDLKYIRPPYGSIKKSQLSLIPVSFIHWDLDTNDWRYKDSDYLVNYVVDNIKDGDIILFHDSYDTTVAAIKKLLPILYSEGYQVMSIRELAQLKGITLENNQIYYKLA